MCLLEERVLRDGLQVIVFCSSVDSTHRLARLLEVYGGFPGEGVYEFSRNVSQVCFLLQLLQRACSRNFLFKQEQAAPRPVALSFPALVVAFTVASYYARFVRTAAMK